MQLTKISISICTATLYASSNIVLRETTWPRATRDRVRDIVHILGRLLRQLVQDLLSQFLVAVQKLIRVVLQKAVCRVKRPGVRVQRTIRYSWQIWKAAKCCSERIFCFKFKAFPAEENECSAPVRRLPSRTILKPLIISRFLECIDGCHEVDVLPSK